MDLSTSLFLFCYIVGAIKGCDIKACYYRNDAALRPPPYTVTPEMLSTQHCNVMIYAFAIIENNRLTPSLTIDEDTPSAKGLYSRFVNLKSKNKHLTMLLSVGGWDFGSQIFSAMSSSLNSRRAFINHVIYFLRDRYFDGLDLHWEFPAYRGGAANDKFTFTMLVKELRESFELESKVTGQPRLKLTAALAGDVKTYAESYEIDKIAKELDFVSIMTYDFSTPGVTLHPSPIYGDSPDDTLSLKYAVEYYLQKGVPKNKLVVGLPFYGRGFNANRSQKPLYRPSEEVGVIDRVFALGVTNMDYFEEKWYRSTIDAGIGRSFATGFDDILGYFEMCPFVESGYRVARHQGVPFLLYAHSTWLGYEDIQSILQKVMFAKRHGLAGVMVWSLDMDDVQKKFCKRTTINLIETVHETCGSEVHATGVDPVLSNENSKPLWPYSHPYPRWKKPRFEPTLSNDVLRQLCKDKGNVNIPHPSWDCLYYIRCKHGVGSVTRCDGLQRYDPEVNDCNWFVFVPICRIF